MPRRNIYLLASVAVISLFCFRKADSAYRSRTGRMFDTFNTVLREIQEHYLEEVEDRELFEGALEGMVSRLDPHSAYIAPRDYTQFRENLEQEFGGIGIEVQWDPQAKVLLVTSPLVGTPAFEKGVLAGDRIIGIDGEATAEFDDVEEATRRLRGPPGKSVQISIARQGEAAPLELEMERAIIQVDTVLGDRRQPDGQWDFFLEGAERVGYLRITLFGERTAVELRKAIAWLSERSAQGAIVDLRNNSGGLLSAATAASDLFVSSGQIVSIRGRNGQNQEVFEASGDAPFTTLPLVVLVNRYSASASEILAACLQDHERALIVGERSWGKGTVQNVIELEGGRSSLKLTTASYWRPSGRNIHRTRRATDQDAWGVDPDPGYLVPLSDEEFRRVLELRRRRDVSGVPGAVPMVPPPETPPAELLPGETTPGELPPSEPAPGELAPSEPAPSELAPGELLPDSPTEGGPLPGTAPGTPAAGNPGVPEPAAVQPVAPGLPIDFDPQLRKAVEALTESAASRAPA